MHKNNKIILSQRNGSGTDACIFPILVLAKTRKGPNCLVIFSTFEFVSCPTVIAKPLLETATTSTGSRRRLTAYLEANLHRNGIGTLCTDILSLYHNDMTCYEIRKSIWDRMSLLRVNDDAGRPGAMRNTRPSWRKLSRTVQSSISMGCE